MTSGLTANSKVYNGMTAATLSSNDVVLSGVVNGDTLVLDTNDYMANFASPGVANGITVTVNELTLSGASAANCMLTQPALSANITAAPVTLASGLTANNKIYNGMTAANLSSNNVVLSGVVSGDTVILDTNGYVANFASPSVGDGIMVTVSGLTLNGLSAPNYTLARPILSANILAASLIVTASNASRPYGQTNPVFTGSLIGLVNGDNITATYSCSATTNSSAGPYTIVPSLMDPTDRLPNYSVTINNATLTVLSPLSVTSLKPGPNSVSVQFSEAINPAVLFLFGSNSPPDLTLVGSNSGAITGSLVICNYATNVTFIKTGGLLAADAYTITLVSATNAFVDIQGNLLAGSGNGIPGQNYVAQFTVTPSGNPAVFLPDFARAPGQTVNVPATNSGIPVTLSGGSNIFSVSVVVQYDTNLLSISDVILGTTLPAGWALTSNPSPPGTLQFSVDGTTPLSSGTNTLALLQGTVPWCAPYGDSGLLTASLTDLNGSTNLGASGDTVQVATLLGDADANGSYTANDAELIQMAFLNPGQGFVAYPLIDPVIIGGIDGSASLTTNDSIFIAQEAVGLNPPQVPALPAPSLSMSISNTVVQVSWPLCVPNYVLQASSVLGPTAIWTTVTNLAMPVGGQQTISLSPVGAT